MRLPTSRRERAAAGVAKPSASSSSSSRDRHGRVVHLMRAAKREANVRHGHRRVANVTRSGAAVAAIATSRSLRTSRALWLAHVAAITVERLRRQPTADDRNPRS